MANINVNTTDGQINYELCRQQGKIYEYAAEHGYNIKNFSDTFLASEFCEQNFESAWSLYHMAPVGEVFYDKLYPEFKDKLIKRNGNNIFDPDAAWWIGFMYREICLETEKPGKEIQKLVNFEDMCLVYPGYHTLAFEDACFQICQKRNLKQFI